MRISVALVLIAVGAIVGATVMYRYAEFSSGPDPVTKQAVRLTGFPR